MEWTYVSTDDDWRGGAAMRFLFNTNADYELHVCTRRIGENFEPIEPVVLALLCLTEDHYDEKGNYIITDTRVIGEKELRVGDNLNAADIAKAKAWANTAIEEE